MYATLTRAHARMHSINTLWVTCMTSVNHIALPLILQLYAASYSSCATENLVTTAGKTENGIY